MAPSSVDSVETGIESYPLLTRWIHLPRLACGPDPRSHYHSQHSMDTAGTESKPRRGEDRREGAVGHDDGKDLQRSRSVGDGIDRLNGEDRADADTDAGAGPGSRGTNGTGAEDENVIVLKMVDGTSYCVHSDIYGRRSTGSDSGAVGAGSTDRGRQDVSCVEGSATRSVAMEDMPRTSSPSTKERLNGRHHNSADSDSSDGDGDYTRSSAVASVVPVSPNIIKGSSSSPHHRHQISYDKESFEDMSRSMGAMWAGCNTFFDADIHDTSASELSSPVSRTGRSYSSARRKSKSVDFNGIAVFGDTDGGEGNKMTSEDGTSFGRQRSSGISGRHPAGAEAAINGGSRVDASSSPRATLEEFKNDATATVAVRQRLRRALARRDASLALLERAVENMESSRRATEMATEDGAETRVKGETSVASHSAEDTRRMAEQMRRIVRQGRANLTSRRKDLERRSELLSQAVRSIYRAKVRLDAAQELLIYGGRGDRGNGAAVGGDNDGENDDAELQGLPRLLMLERKLWSRRRHMVLELQKIYPVNRGGGGWAAGATASQPSSPTDARQGGMGGPIPAVEALSICGVLLGRPAASPGRQRKNIDKAECETFGAALGYAAHAIDIIASYLDIPLRYSLRVFASRSIIVDLAPPLRLANPPEVNGEASTFVDPGAAFSLYRSDSITGASGSGILLPSKERGRKAPAPASDSMPKPPVYPSVALPLYLEGVHQTNEFHAAIWLLNKNLEQLLSACGESSCGYGDSVRSHIHYRCVSPSRACGADSFAFLFHLLLF